MWCCMLSGAQHGEERASLNATVVCVNKPCQLLLFHFSTVLYSVIYYSIVNVSAMQQELRGRKVDVVDVVMSTQHG